MKDYEDRRRTIESLLDHFEHYFQLGGSLAGGTGSGDGPSLSSMASSPPVVELLRCMELCRRMAPNHYKHLIGHYGAEWRLVDETVMVPSPMNPQKLIPAPTRKRERVVPSWVAWRLVDRAVDFLLGVWRFPPPSCEACSSRDPLVRCGVHVRLELPYALRAAQARRLVEFVDQDGPHLTEAA